LDSINFRIIAEELFMSWRLKKQIGENVMYVAAVLKHKFKFAALSLVLVTAAE
jgi:hypothetical protein